MKHLFALTIWCILTVTSAQYATVDFHSAFTAGEMGYQIFGAVTSGQTGTTVGGGCDVNGDGHDDAFVYAKAAPYAVFGTVEVVYVHFGYSASTPIADKDELSFVTGVNGYRIVAATVGDSAGISVSCAGDINHDGVADMIIGAPDATANAGITYVVYGQPTNQGVAVDILLATLSAARGFTIVSSSSGDHAGSSVDGVGDMNGDGRDDLIVGVSGWTDGARTFCGAAFVVYGQVSNSNVNLATLTPGSVGYKLVGRTSSGYTGTAVSGAGDFNGDGFKDVIIASPFESTNGRTANGLVYVIFGKSATTVNIDLGAFVTGSAGLTISGAEGNDNLGQVVDCAGDVNGDGFSDVLIGAASSAFGKAYVVFGRRTVTTFLDLLSIANPNGFQITGASGTYLGLSVSAAGDVNGDGYGDIVVGAPMQAFTGLALGAAYILLGHSNHTSFELADTSTFISGPAVGFQARGKAADNRFGMSVGSVGDINGDGYDDVIVGAYSASYGSRSYSGVSYVLLGKAPTARPTSAPTRSPTVAPTKATNFTSVDTALLYERGQGFKIFGAISGDRAGMSTYGGNCDFNGDGFPDFLTGVPEYNGGRGKVVVLFGHNSSTQAFANVDVVSALVVPGFTVSGANADDKVGTAVSCADVNKDGYADLLIGAPGISSYTGYVYVLYGKRNLVTMTLSGFSGNGVNGRMIYGALPNGKLGSAVSDIGDFNGDGYPDVAVAAPYDTTGGKVYVLFGSTSNNNIALASFTWGTQGFKVHASTSYDKNGAVLSKIGDMNGDGYSDFVIGVPESGDGGSSLGGNAVVLFGHKSATYADVTLSTFSGVKGFRVLGPLNSLLGTAVSGAGDINNDGYQDLVVGAPKLDKPSVAGCGAVYVIYGHSNRTTFADVNLAINAFPTSASFGYAIFGRAAGDFLGMAVSSAGDTNGDGFSDIVIGATMEPIPNRGQAGAAYVIFGAPVPPGGGDLALASFVSGRAGYKLWGEDSLGSFGDHVSYAGDFNADGYGDFLISASQADYATRAQGGISYLVYGKGGQIASSRPTVLPTRLPTAPPSIRPTRVPTARPSAPANFTAVDSLYLFEQSKGFKMFGAHSGDLSSTSIGNKCDVNGDGYPDILIGAPQESNMGKVYVVYGHNSSRPYVNMDLLTLSASTGLGFVIIGSDSGDKAGTSVSCAGDVNKDGFDDILVGAPGVNSLVGFLNVIYGKRNPVDVNLHGFAGGLAGYRVYGSLVEGKLGTATSGIGDYNGDGYADYAVSAPSHASGGVLYVLFGGTSNADIDLNSWQWGTNGFRVYPATPGDAVGSVISAVGDMNGDGFDDFVFGVPQSADGGYAQGGIAVVLFGRRTVANNDIQLPTVPVARGFRILGTGASYLGQSVGGAGDVNNDGYDDVIVGAPRLNYNSVTVCGAAYVLYGHSNLTAFVDVSTPSFTASASLGFAVYGKFTFASLGSSVSSAGDTNNDGYDDIIIGSFQESYGTRSFAGASYLILGAATHNDVLLSAFVSGAGGYKLVGEDGSDAFGSVVSNAGDFNGDGYDDYLVGASTGDYSSRTTCGITYLVYGKSGKGPSAPTIAPSYIQRPMKDIDLLTFGTSAGYRMYGEEPAAELGNSVNSAGDFNGDGIDDIIVGSWKFDGAFSNTGRAYIVFGNRNVASTSPVGNNAVSGIGVTIKSTTNLVQAGAAASTIGDYNNDGFDDILVSAPFADYIGRSTSGVTYVLFGHAAPFVDITLQTYTTGLAAGFRIFGGSTDDMSGNSAGAAGDVNGDGFSDIIVGAAASSPYAVLAAGTAYVLFGRNSAIVNIDLLNFGNTVGFRIYGGMHHGLLGYSVSTAGDFDGDGFADVIVGAQNAYSATGEVYVLYGHSSATAFTDMDLRTFVTGNSGFKITGGAVGDRLGYSVSSAGDVNSDGFGDIIIGAPEVDAPGGRSSAGAAYVLYGNNRGTPFLSADINMTTFKTGDNGFKVLGATTSAYTGSAVSSAGDFNVDGYGDILIGAPTAAVGTKLNAGISYVIYGARALDRREDVNLASATIPGFKIFGGSTDDQSGSAVGCVGDVNADGVSDIIMGAKDADPFSNASGGYGYVLFGAQTAPSSQPSRQPSSRPSTQPSNQPTQQPVGNPSSQPSRQPSRQPSSAPSRQPTATPTGQPSSQPSMQPSAQPASSPSNQPSIRPTCQPSGHPSRQPSSAPSGQPSTRPTRQPSSQPSFQPSAQPASRPSCHPSAQPSIQPSMQPTSRPSAQPSDRPSSQPSVQSTSQPSSQPSARPTSQPSLQPFGLPSSQPTHQPSRQPSSSPSIQPSNAPSGQPSTQPSRQPTVRPTIQPSVMPSCQPSIQPSGQPSVAPTSQPTAQPAKLPSSQPNAQPSEQPTSRPSRQPTVAPSCRPSSQPTHQLSALPSSQPSARPSVKPSLIPSATPSQQPSSQPSAVPSRQPSARPTGQPTCQPSNHPSRLPSARPSSQPSSNPSCQPSAVPSDQPSSLPTGQPSSQPSNQPSTQPSNQPSGSPTCQSSALPSVQPSEVPTTQPSNRPSSQPSQNPSGQPSALPTSQLSQQPSNQPSNEPSVQPTRQPSSAPSSASSSQPSDVPTSQPSLQPSCIPTLQPSTEPAAGPTCQPTVQPSTSPSAQPSAQPISTPSAQPTVQPSNQPSAGPSGVPSAQPRGAPSVQPSGSPSEQPTETPSAQPSSQPSGFPSVQPSSQPSSWPSSQPSRQPSAQPSTAPTVLYNASVELAPRPAPNITSIAVTHANRTWISLDVRLQKGQDGMVYCAAFAGMEYKLGSVNEIVKQNFAVIAKNGVGSVTLTGLLPASPYNVYCSTASLQGSMMSCSVAARNVIRTSTKCCKAMYISLQIASIRSASSLEAAVSIRFDAPPTSPVEVYLSFVSAAGDLVVSSVYPVMARLSPTDSIASARSFRVIAGGQGSQTLVAALSGSSPDEYTVIYTSSRAVEVLSAAAEPPVPTLKSAMFSNDGSSVVISFGAPTNKGKLSQVFPCASILTFSGSATAVCQWSDRSTITVYTRYAASVVTNTLTVQSPVAVVANAIRAECTLNVATLCDAWTAVPAVSVLVQPPADPVVPIVSLSLPATISACSELKVDLTNSVGGAGRPWSSVSFKVLTSAGETLAATQLERYLTANFTLSPPTVVPSFALSKGYVYSIQAKVCNFLEACGTTTKSVSALASEALVPVTSITGQTQRSIYSSSALAINSVSYTQSCGSPAAYGNMRMSWAVNVLSSTGVPVPTAIQSISQSPATFKLSPYTLTASAEYEIVLTVTSLVSLLTSTAKVSVTVQKGNIVAVIAQGSSVFAKGGSALTLDASGSYDEDLQSRRGSEAGLSFIWSCVQLKPDFSANCSALHFGPSLSLQNLTVTPVVSSKPTTSRVTVTVYDGTRSCAVHTDVIVTDTVVSDLLIANAPASLKSIDTGKSLNLFGRLKIYTSCAARWSVDDQAIDLFRESRTATQKSLQPLSPAAYAPFNLVISGNALSQRATYVFTLSCGDASTAVTVTTNGAPLPGEFIIDPTSGTELTTAFSFAAVQWTDPDLPLRYQFGYNSPTSLSNLVVVSASELAYAGSVLPAGAEYFGSLLNCSLFVFDSLGATQSQYANISVAVMGIADRSEALNSLLSGGSGSIDDTKRALSVVSSVLNHANCTGAANCTAMNRLLCSKTAGQCGSCLSGYLGDRGDRNTPCVASQDVTLQETKSCSRDVDCGHAQVCDIDANLCEYSEKSCLNRCSGHGSCGAYDVATGKANEDCRLSDTGCETSCDCVDGYTGRDCGISLAELVVNRALRSRLLQSLQDLTSTEDVNIQSVSEWSASLYSLVLNPYEMSATDIDRMVAIANSTIVNALALGITNIDAMVGILEATNTAASVRKLDYNPNDVSSIANTNALSHQNNTAAGIITVVSAFADLVSRSKVFGENDTVFSYDNFRFSSGLHSLATGAANVTLRSPQSEGERRIGGLASSVVLSPASRATAGDGTVAVKVISVYPQTYTPDTGKFLSSPIYLQVQPHDGSAARDVLSHMEYVFQHNADEPSFVHPRAQNFTSHCEGRGRGENYTYICPGSGFRINNNCSRGAGTYTAFCPVLTPRCGQVDLVSADIDIMSSCIVTSYNESFTVCSCPVTAGARRTMRRVLATTREQEIMDATGVSNMMATSSYVALNFADTFTVAESFNSPDAVLLVIFMFATLWGAGVILLSVCVSRNYMSKRDKAKQLTNKVAAATAALQDGSAVTQAKKVLLDYIDNVIPSVYGEGKSSFGRMLGELRAHHRYLSLFTLGDGQISLYGKLLIIGKLLTVETMQMFVLAVLYDVQEPEDDGTCLNFGAANTCLERKSVFDSSQTYCQWLSDDAGCSYRKQQFTIKIFLYILILTSIFTSIISTPLDYFFKISNAPLIADALQDQVSAAEHDRRRRSTIATGVRRLSALTSTAVQNARRMSVVAVEASQEYVKRHMWGLNSFLSGNGAKERVIANRDISEDLEHLHHQAVAVLPSVSSNSDSILRQKHAAALHMKSKAFSRKLDYADLGLDNDDAAEVKADLRPAAATSSDEPRRQTDAVAYASLLSLCEEVVAQRELMPKESAHTAVYDDVWGIETSITSLSASRKNLTALTTREVYAVTEQARAAIYDTIVASDEDARELNESLPRYTVHHGGLAILNLFLLDLLGRTTVAAKIFKNKFEEDFEQTKAVSRWFQVSAVLILVGCNAFFIYYSLLKAFQQGKTWQYKYLQGCIAQILIETLLNETLECLWLNYFVPDLVRKEVNKATVVISKVVEQITSTADRANGRSILFLDATQYLFSSTKVARAHPSLLESIVVLNYQTHLPGELSRTWPHSKQHKLVSQRFADRLEQKDHSTVSGICYAVPMAILSISTTIVLMMQYLGTMSFNFQRVVLRFVQPLLLSGLTLMWLFASASPAGLIVMIVGSATLFGAFTWRQYYVYRAELRNSHRTAPEKGDILNIDSDIELEDIESIPSSKPSTPKTRTDDGAVSHKTRKLSFTDRGRGRDFDDAELVHAGEEEMTTVADAKCQKHVNNDRREEHKDDVDRELEHALFVENIRKRRSFSFFDSDDEGDHANQRAATEIDTVGGTVVDAGVSAAPVAVEIATVAPVKAPEKVIHSVDSDIVDQHFDLYMQDQEKPPTLQRTYSFLDSPSEESEASDPRARPVRGTAITKPSIVQSAPTAKAAATITQQPGPEMKRTFSFLLDDDPQEQQQQQQTKPTSTPAVAAPVMRRTYSFDDLGEQKSNGPFAKVRAPAAAAIAVRRTFSFDVDSDEPKPTPSTAKQPPEPVAHLPVVATQASSGLRRNFSFLDSDEEEELMRPAPKVPNTKETAALVARVRTLTVSFPSKAGATDALVLHSSSSEYLSSMSEPDAEMPVRRVVPAGASAVGAGPPSTRPPTLPHVQASAPSEENPAERTLQRAYSFFDSDDEAEAEAEAEQLELMRRQQQNLGLSKRRTSSSFFDSDED